MARILRPRTFLATLMSAAILLVISALALLPRESHLFPLNHLLRVIVAAETLIALLFFHLLVRRFREPSRLYALLIDSLIVSAVSIPFVVLSALIASLNLWPAVISQLLYFAMILFSASLGILIQSKFGASVYLLVVFLLIAAIPLTGELITQFASPLNLSAISPIIIIIQTVTQGSVPLLPVTVIIICVAVTAFLLGPVALQRKGSKTL